MPKALTLELPDDVHAMLLRAAERANQTPDEWLVSRLRAALAAAEQRAAEMARMWREVGSIEMPPQTGGPPEARTDND